MSNNDDKDRWETFCKLYDKLSSKEEMRELFEEEIKCFSVYLSHVNQDYVYNATFFSYSDIPISLSSMWLEKTVPVFQEIMHEYDKEKGVQKIIDEMTDNDKLSKDYTIDNFRAQIQVDYDPDSDNIQYFADYLMDLDDTKHSFYFIYTYEPSITAFEKGLNERYNRMAARVRDIKNPGCIEKETKFYFLKEELLRIYCNAVIEKCYFCNSNYKNENSMEVAAFKSLFNFQNIPAMRELDDNESDSSKGISKRVIALLKDNDTWVEATKKLPDGLHHFRRHIFRGCGRAGDQSGHHASSDRVADRVHPAAWSWTSKSREQRICRCIGFHRKLSE